MNLGRLCALAGSLFLAMAPATAGQAATDAATAEELLRDSGLAKALGGIVEQVETDFHETLANLPQRPEPAEIERLEHLIGVAFAPEELRGVAAEVVRRRTDGADVAVLREWFASADGRRIAKAEAAASWKKEIVQKQKRAGILLLERMPAPRRKVLDQVLSAARAIPITTRIAIRTVPTLLTAIRRAHPELPIPSEKELLSRFERAAPRIERQLYAGSIEIYASLYEPVRDAQLERYAAMLASPAGSRFTEVLGEALEAAVLRAVARFGSDLVPNGTEQTT